MYRFALAVIALLISVSSLAPPWQTTHAAHAAEIDTVVSLEPSVSLHGGTTAHRDTVRAAVDRFGGAGLELPDLDIYLDDDHADCLGYQGYFKPEGTTGVIHLCFPGEFLALHELGHAWEHFNLDDATRDRFEAFSGAPAWDSQDVPWGRRASEIAATTIAHGLLSVPLDSADSRTKEFDRFEALTNVVTPRLAEIVPETEPVQAMTDDERSRAVAYADWRRTGDAAA